VEQIEQSAIALGNALFPDWNPPKFRSRASSSDTDQQREQLFARMIPKIDSSLTVTEKILLLLNQTFYSLRLEPIPAVDANLTSLQRQVRFIDKAKRIRSHLSAMEPLVIQNNLQSVTKKYAPPTWSVPPQVHYYFEVRNQSTDQISKKIPLWELGHYLIGRAPICNVSVEDPSCSRQHAVVQFRPGDPDLETGEIIDEIYIYDLNSTSGTYVNGMNLQTEAYYPLLPGDVIQFGQYHSVFILRDGTEPGMSPPVIPPKEVEAVPDPLPVKVERSPPIEIGSKPKHSLAQHLKTNEPENLDSIIPDDFGPEIESAMPKDPSEEEEVELKSKFYVDNPLSEKTVVEKTETSEGRSFQDDIEAEERSTSTAVEETASPATSSRRRNNSISRITSIKKLRKKHRRPSTTDPRKSPSFNEEDYKRKMIEAYEKQQQENAEILRQRKEREAQGLPPVLELPHVAERKPRPKKKKRWWLLK